MSGALPRRAAAALLLLLASAPGYLLLRGSGAGFPGAVTAALAADFTAYLWTGTLVLGVLALLGGRLLSGTPAGRAASIAAGLVTRPSTPLFGLLVGALATLFAWYINRSVLYGEPNLIDALSQLVHARYLAAGRLAGPVSAFWHMPQTLVTEQGWVSQYPPGHLLLLALGLRLGAVELAGPLALGATVFVTCALAHRLLPQQPVAARAGTLLLALSPFAAAHAAAYLSHTTAALFSVIALYCALRAAEEGSRGGAAGMGLALALLFATRPLTGVVVGAVAALLLGGAFEGRLRRPRAAVLFAALLGAVPVLAALAAYNAHFFGAPLRFGYTAALGPDGGLGFGTDPWGNRYGIREAFGYTSAELSTLNLFLAETPLPLVSLAAAWLLVAPRLLPGVRLLATWSLLPLLAHLFYWHHGLHMGPRMLNEYAPAWALLVAVAAAELLRMLPQAWARLPGWSPRRALATALAAAAIFALVVGAPGRIGSYRRPVMPLAYAAAQLPQPSVVFVHGAWASRVAMQLAAGGMRLDSLESVMRRNDTCALQQWLDGTRGGSVDFQRIAAGAPAVEIAPGSHARRAEGESWPAACLRQAAADSFGVAEVSAYLWRAGLPGIAAGETLLVRDLGPERNARLIAELGRPAYLLEIFPDGSRLALQPYRQAMGRVWRDAS